MHRLLGFILLLLGSLGIVAEKLNLKFPTASWFFDTSNRVPFFHSGDFPWYGWVTAIAAVVSGLALLIFSAVPRPRHPASLLRKARFAELKRGVWSLRILLLLVILSSLDFLLVGNKPLIMKYEGEFYFPAFERKVYQGGDFGVEGSFREAPANFRSIKKVFHEENGSWGKMLLSKKAVNWVLMPPIPYSPTGDSLAPPLTDLELGEDGLYRTANGKPYSGLAARVYKPEAGTEDTPLHLRYRLRNGIFSGPVDGWGLNGERIYSSKYVEGQQVSEDYYGEGTLDAYLQETPDQLAVVNYHPSPPSKQHLLGTDSNGNDVLAYLFGGLQVNIQAAMFYIPFVYAIGVTIGLMMGYFGGWFDLIFQRIIEALEAIPMLFVLIIVSSVVPLAFKGLGMILVILVTFGWMGKTYLMRSAAYKEKSRDYVSSAKLLGASTPRILFKHILPNIISILVTVVPFAIAGVVTAITSLDYLGFGLPPEYASWGKLLEDGLKNLSAPWLVSTAFCSLVFVLSLITFVGEAIREAWDPRKFTSYR